jgi:hypothetical protein
MFRELRRMMAASLLRFANVDTGGTWELVSVREEVLETHMLFHFRGAGWGETDGAKTHNIRVTITPIEDI